MTDFEVPLNPGWCVSFEKEHGDLDAANGVSPQFLASVERLQVKAYSASTVAEEPALASPREAPDLIKAG